MQTTDDRRLGIDNGELQFVHVVGNTHSAPIEHMETAIITVGREVQSQARSIHPAMPMIVAKFFPKEGENSPEDIEKRHRFGLDNMAAVASLMVGPLPASIEPDVKEGIDIYNAYFMGEKFSDDLEKLTESGLAFLHRGEVEQFNQGMREAFIIEDEQERLAHILRFTDEINTTNIPTEIRGLIQEKLGGMPQEMRAFLPENFIENPERWFLAFNAFAGAKLYHTLLSLSRQNPELQMIADQALQGLENRYGGMDAVVSDPTMPVEAAVAVGKATILTDVFSGLFLVAADAAKRRGEDDFYVEIAQNQELICRGIDSHSALIRLLNDGGHAILNPERAIQDLEYIRERFDKEHLVPPRAILRRLNEAKEYQLERVVEYISIHDGELAQRIRSEGFTRSTLRAIEQLLLSQNGTATAAGMIETFDDAVRLLTIANNLSRLVKDAIEGEYNSNLNSSMRADMTPDERFEQLKTNIWYSSSAYRGEIGKFIPILMDLERKCGYARNWMGRFVLFNKEMYGIDGADYDRVVQWYLLESMAAIEIPFEERLAA